MIYILHGDNVSKSRALIVNQQKKLNIETKTEINMSELTLSQLLERCISSSLFGETTFLVFDITDFKNPDVVNYIETLKKAPKDSTIILFAQKNLPKTNAFLNDGYGLVAKVFYNPIEEDSNIFRFVDNLFSKKREALYVELDKLLKSGSDQFYIFNMILYGLRTLFAYINGFEKSKKLSPYQLEKLKTQTLKFTPEKVSALFGQLHEIDKKVKTGELDQEIFLTLAIEKVLNS